MGLVAIGERVGTHGRASLHVPMDVNSPPNRNTLEYIGIWEKIHNPDSNYGEFAIISSKSGLNSFKIRVKEWTKRTNAIGCPNYSEQKDRL